MKKIKGSNCKMMLVIGKWSSISRYRMICLLLPFFISSCSVSKQIGKQADTILLKDSSIRTGHIGISIYEPATNKYWYNYNATHYFIPASNTKLFTLYAGMKYLGDSLVGLRVFNDDGNLYLFPSGDPTFLNKEFSYQPVFNYLKNSNASNITIVDSVWREDPLGSGWSWNDYNDNYMAERSSMPVFGNIFELSGTPSELHLYPRFSFNYQYEGRLQLSSAYRELGTNNFIFKFNGDRKKTFYVPFATLKGETNKKILSDTLHQKILPQDDFVPVMPGDAKVIVIHSQPSDSLFKPMMHRSDNFFAEQTLLMASNEYLGYMSDEKIIDTLLKTDLKDVPQKPRWVDGSGLSRYNLFTPQSFVYIINKTKNEFGWERLKNILPTGGTGTLASYYRKDSGFIYAKTGTLSNNCALSGVLITSKGRLLIFSVLANNYITGATPVRRAVEKFLLAIRKEY